MTTRDPLHGEPWRVTLAVLAALATWCIGSAVLAGLGSVWAGEIAVGGGQ
jgi:hypothetical protein